MELYFLGTGAGLPSKQRNVTAIALTLYDERGTFWLFDCGEATQHQILNSPLKLSKLEKIFITHLHGDHIFGLPGLLASRSAQGSESLLSIYGPKGIKQYVDTCLKVSSTNLQYPIQIVECAEGVIFQDEKFIVYARLLEHGIPSYGFRIEERDKPGVFYPERAKLAGIPKGPLFAKLKSGETIVLEDGRTFHGVDFVGPPVKGRVIAIMGDTLFSEKTVGLAKVADVLVHEATFMNFQADMAKRYHHSTSTQAARVALQAGVKCLILSHISARFQGAEENTLLLEAQSIFSNTVVAYDHMSFSF